MSDRPTHDPVELATTMAWERAKGELRSIVAAIGSQYNGNRIDDRPKYQVVEEYVDEFVKYFEDNEYHRP